MSDKISTYEKWLIVGKKSYAEYQKHTPDAVDWDTLSTDHQEGYTAAMFHSLYIIGAVPLRNGFVLGK